MTEFKAILNITEISAILEGFPKSLRHSVWLMNFHRDKDDFVRKLYF